MFNGCLNRVLAYNIVNISLTYIPICLQLLGPISRTYIAYLHWYKIFRRAFCLVLPFVWPCQAWHWNGVTPLRPRTFFRRWRKVWKATSIFTTILKSIFNLRQNSVTVIFRIDYKFVQLCMADDEFVVNSSYHVIAISSSFVSDIEFKMDLFFTVSCYIFSNKKKNQFSLT